MGLSAVRSSNAAGRTRLLFYSFTLLKFPEYDPDLCLRSLSLRARLVRGGLGGNSVRCTELPLF